MEEKINKTGERVKRLSDWDSVKIAGCNVPEEHSSRRCMPTGHDKRIPGRRRRRRVSTRLSMV